MSLLHFVPGAPRLALDLAGHGPFVLFMHGIGGNRSNWRAQLAAFAPHFACAAWDARGYGASDDYDGPLAFDDFVSDVLRVLDHVGVERAHLVGLSMGGRIAMRTALLHHEMAAKLGQAPVSVVPDAGHLSNIENADAFNRLALDWLVSRSDLASVSTQWPQGV